MKVPNLGARRAIAIAATMICAAALSACGDDDSSDVAELLITATGDRSGVEFELDTTELSAGATEITLDNQSETDSDGQLIYTSEEHSDEEVIAELENAVNGEAVADWFQGGGGPGTTAAGESSTVTQELQPGTYYVSTGDELPEPPLPSFTVSDDDGAELPEADATISAGEYSFAGEGLTAGESTVLLDNEGEEWHHFIAAKMVEGATLEDVEEFFRTEEGEPPLEEGDGTGNNLESTVLEGGTSQLVDVDLEAGNYVFMCFIADKQGGPPHVEQGMISEVEVTE